MAPNWDLFLPRRSHVCIIALLLSGAAARQSRAASWPPAVRPASQHGPLPPWNASWRMADSTVVMPCSTLGFLNLSDFEGYGLIDVDWSNAKGWWAAQRPMKCEEALVQQAAAIKAAFPSTRVFIYRNIVKALNWYSSVSYALDNSSFSSWFIPFVPGGSLPNGSWHTPACDPAYSPPLCTPFYHDTVQTPTPEYGCNGLPCDCGSSPCGEYLWSHVTGGASLRNWLVDFFSLGHTGLGSGVIDGFYYDDSWSDRSQPVQPWQPQPNGFCDHNRIGGPSEEDYWCVADAGLGQGNTTSIMREWQGTMAAVIDALVARGAFSWQYFTFATTPPAYYCATFFREWGADYAALPLMYELSNVTLAGPPPAVDLDLAFFLLIRGPFAWIGFNWIGCDYAYWKLPPQLRTEYGSPLGDFYETVPNASGVFVRNFTRANVTVDCNSFTSSISVVN